MLLKQFGVEHFLWPSQINTILPFNFPWASLVAQLVKNSPAMRERSGFDSWVGIQYSGLENSMDCIGPGVSNSQRQLSNFHSLTSFNSLFQ